jgi:hypothetical protein
MAARASTPAASDIGASTDPAAAKILGLATLGLVTLTALVQLKKTAASRSVHPSLPGIDALFLATPASFESRALHGSAALLATSVLADSTVEHFRGEFENPGMLTPLLTSLMTVLAGVSAAASPSGRPRFGRSGIYLTSVAVGAAGTMFHFYNVRRRPGGLSWLNLFYAAPLGAPAALSLAGLIGLAAERLRDPRQEAPAWLGQPAGRVLSALTAVGLAGTSIEAGLLHFRGAFQNPFMWLPVTVPPVAAALMVAAAVGPAQVKRRFTRIWLALTGMLGIGGVGFHAFGVARQMGGWRNWRQNVLSGPPLSAPPAFSGLALAALPALSLLSRGQSRERVKS